MFVWQETVFFCFTRNFTSSVKNKDDIINRAVTKISSCGVNTTRRRGIKQLGISFGSIFLLFSFERSRGHVYRRRGKSLELCTYQLPSQVGDPGELPGHLHNDVYKSPLPKTKFV